MSLILAIIEEMNKLIVQTILKVSEKKTQNLTPAFKNWTNFFSIFRADQTVVIQWLIDKFNGKIYGTIQADLWSRQCVGVFGVII